MRLVARGKGAGRLDRPDVVVPSSTAIFTIGRLPECDWSIEGDFVSRRHAQVRFHEGRFYLIDLGSANGTLLDQGGQGEGVRLEPERPYPIEVGDRFFIDDFEISVQAEEFTRPDARVMPFEDDDEVVWQEVEDVDELLPDEGPEPIPETASSPAGAAPAPGEEDDGWWQELFQEEDSEPVSRRLAPEPEEPDFDPFAAPPESPRVPEPSYEPEPLAPGHAARAPEVPPRRRASPPPASDFDGFDFDGPSGRGDARGGPTDDDELVHAFLSGLGLDLSAVPAERAADVFESLGEALRLSIHGLFELMGQRAAFRREFRVEATTLQSMDNNAFNVGHNPDQPPVDILRVSLLEDTEGYLRLPQAVRHSLDDLKTHQVAMVHGMREAFQATMDRIHPDEIRELAKGAGKSVFKSQEAIWWATYEENYAQVCGQDDASFHRVYGVALARAYNRSAGKV